jgi:hypothetical protein
MLLQEARKLRPKLAFFLCGHFRLGRASRLHCGLGAVSGQQVMTDYRGLVNIRQVRKGYAKTAPKGTFAAPQREYHRCWLQRYLG